MYVYNLGTRFQQIVKMHGDRIALWYGPSSMVTYSELNHLANKMAGHLAALDVKKRDVVAIAGTKSLMSFASMLGSLKIGAVYTILDPESPVERLHKIISVCCPKVIIAEDELLKNCDELIRELDITPQSASDDKAMSLLARYPDADLEQTVEITGTNPAYIMFTSGSTGFPKGAVMTHENVLNLIDWSHEEFGITHDDVLTNVNPQYFDNSVFDIYSALFAGATLVPFSREETRDPRRLVDKIAEAQCSIWFSVPSLLIFLQTMRATDGSNLGSIRAFIFGGEGYPKAKLHKLFTTYRGKSEFYNVYGPTECTCICSSYKLTDNDFADLQGFPPLGRIARNFNYLILDDEGKEMPSGSIGELCLLGPNVGRGYYKDPERTALSFVRNPHNEAYHEVMYKTGDMVRFNPEDGKLHIHGRSDNQIKHMGYRIELEEIETALHHLPYVSEAVALHGIVGGFSRLLAVVSLKGERSDEQIRKDLLQIIPDYMMPSEFRRESSIPKNPNGKVDRKFLREKFIS